MFCKRLCKLQWRSIFFNFMVVVYIGLIFICFFNSNSRVKYYISDEFHRTQKTSNMCIVNKEQLGKVQLDMNIPSIHDIEVLHESVSNGGKWTPRNCVPIQRVALIIPHRNRKGHLLILLNRLHTLLQKQKSQYHVFVIEQSGGEEFNRGRLLNIGVHEALKVENFDCFIFHDVDLLPENDANWYICDDNLRHLASAIDEMRYHVMYNNYAGGVVAVKTQNLIAMNGYSNDYWGWGSEDDDFSARSMGIGLLLSRPPENIGQYKMVKHDKQWRSNNGYDLFLTWRSRWKRDGLNNIEEKFKLLHNKATQLYTNITVDIGQSHIPQYQSLPKESFLWFLQFFFS